MNPHASSFTPGGVSGVGVLFTPYSHQASYPDDDHQLLDHVQPNSEGYFEVSNFCEPNVPLDGMTVLAFDPHEEVLWTGTGSGRVVSYTSPTMHKYSAWRTSFDAVRRLLPSENGITALAASSVKCYTKGGLTLASYHAEGADLQAMMFTNQRQTELLIGGLSESMQIFDLKRGKVMKEIPVPSGVTAMTKTSRLFCVGHTDGKVTLRDPRSHRTEHSFVGHLSGISDMDVHSDLLVTCGYSNRMGQVIVDPLVKVFDIRTMRVLLPVSVPAGASFVRFHPRFSSTFMIAAQSGQFELCDAQSCVTGIQRSMVDTRGQLLISADLSPSGETVSFGDTLGYIHLWADREDFRVNLHSKNSLEFVDPRPPPPAFPITENSSLTLSSSFTFPTQLQQHMPVPRTPGQAAAPKRAHVLSDWSGHMYFAVPRAPEPIDPNLLKNMRQVDFVGVIPNTPGTSLRNQVRRPVAPQFDSTQVLESTTNLFAAEQEEHFPASPDKKMRARARAPRNYRRIPIRATKLGFEDFDFSPYNRTYYSGLENILPNSYINPIIHLLFYIPQLRIHVRNHLCDTEFCLLSELGFLFHMMEISKGEHACQAKNLLRTLHEIPQAARLGLLEEDSSIPVPRMTERFSSFVMSHLNRESQSHEHILRPEQRKHIDPDFIDELFGMTLQITNHCLTCSQRTSLENRVHHLKLALPSAQNTSAHSFASVFRQTLSADSTTQTWCENCKTFRDCDQTKEVLELPNILFLNAPQTDAAQAFWTSVSDDYNPNAVNEHLSQWAPFVMKAQRDSKSKKWAVQEYSDTTPQSDPVDLYDLTAVIAAVSDSSEPRGHVVCFMRMHPWCQRQAGEEVQNHSWFLFNDFHILPISKYEAIHIDADWKVPVVLVYSRRQLDEQVPIPEFVNPITEDVILNDRAKNAADVPTFAPLTRETLPQPGDELAIDAEFVRIREEEFVEKPDGSRFVVRPGDFSLARVSVLSAKQPEGTCIMDDYIATRDSTILDYLTQFSGIVPGDLDPSSSTHHVTSLKVAYMKLRWLVDRGCKFIGHGLRKDFRIINIVVPPEQVIDTVELYYIDRQRKISLKFLTSHLLNMDIQKETHDSIEDARSALLLYRKYQELDREGNFQEVLDQIYEYGRSLQWKLKADPSAKLNAELSVNKE